MENVVKEKKIDNNVQPVAKGEQFTLPTWSLVGVLILVFVILKKVIYLKDEKRKN